MSAYCLSTWFTSWTEVPLPRAIRLRRRPSIKLSSARSAAVMELMIASTLESCFSFTCTSFGSLANGPTFGSIPISCSIDPIFRTCRN